MKRIYLYKYFEKKEENVKEAPFSVLFKRVNDSYGDNSNGVMHSFFSFDYIIKQLEKLLGIKLNENFFSKQKKVKELDVNFDVNKILYIEKLNGKINDSFKILTGNFYYLNSSRFVNCNLKIFYSCIFHYIYR